MMPATLILVGASLAAAYTDLARRRIPNVLTFGLAAVAMVLAATHGLAALGIALTAYTVLLIAGTFGFSRGWIGGGDVKLLAAGAACAGWPGLIPFLLYMSVAGGMLAIAELTRTNRLRGALENVALAAYVGNLHHGVTLDRERPKLPYALAIAAGALLLLASETVAPWLQLVHV